MVVSKRLTSPGAPTSKCSASHLQGGRVVGGQGEQRQRRRAAVRQRTLQRTQGKHAAATRVRLRLAD